MDTSADTPAAERQEQNTIRLHAEDGVVIARRALPPGTPVAPNARLAEVKESR